VILLKEKIASGEKILLDGAFNTELASRGFDIDRPLFTAQALIEQPELVEAIHADYVLAGAEVIMANTFCTAGVALRMAGLEHLKDELTDKAIALAESAIEKNAAGKDVQMAAVMSRLSHYFPGNNPSNEELLDAYEDHASQIALGGVDVIFCETMSTVHEAVTAVQAVKSVGIDAIVSFTAKDSRHLISGETIDMAMRAITPLEPLAICLNCCSLEVTSSAVASLLSMTKIPIGAYAATADVNSHFSGNISSGISSIQYLRHVERWLEQGVSLIGGCCGTTPEHIKTIKEKFFQS
jgi:homocysteine S-methyltransferase